MKKFAKRILRAGSTTALALLIVSGGVPVKPFSQMFDRAVITAFANEGKYSVTLPEGLEYESEQILRV